MILNMYCGDPTSHSPHLGEHYFLETHHSTIIWCDGEKRPVPHLLHCSNWIAHTAHEHENYDIDANRHETVLCDGIGKPPKEKPMIKFILRETPDFAPDIHHIDLVDDAGTIYNTLQITRKEAIEMTHGEFIRWMRGEIYEVERKIRS